jgi:hypothetical protein
VSPLLAVKLAVNTTRKDANEPLDSDRRFEDHRKRRLPQSAGVFVALNSQIKRAEPVLQKEEPRTMANFVITGKAEQTDESSYTVQSTGEVVTKIQLTLNVPGMQDRVLCEMPVDVSPKPDILEMWEMEESWLVVSANTMRALGFTRSNARPGEKAVGALVIFQATEVREATADERRALMEARKVSKLQAKQRRAARKAERDAAKAQPAEKQSA